MKKLVHAMACFIITASSVALAQSQDAARVVYSEFGCTWYVAANDKGYYLFEWFGGHMPVKGDVMVGPINSFGMKEVTYNRNRDGKVWLDNYWMTKNAVIDAITRKCP